MITEVTLRTGALRLVLWKRIAVGLMTLALGAVALPAQAATEVRKPPGRLYQNNGIRVRELAYRWAETQAGARYRYGAQGDGAYDCSGLVRAAYLHAGIWLPRTTGEMLQYWRLDRETEPRQGDLVFFGTGHVELYAGRRQSFGAEDNSTGTWWNRWWPGDWWPTGFYRVRPG
jgi:cell wall-associated NlpC family hydrolase